MTDLFNTALDMTDEIYRTDLGASFSGDSAKRIFGMWIDDFASASISKAISCAVREGRLDYSITAKRGSFQAANEVRVDEGMSEYLYTDPDNRWETCLEDAWLDKSRGSRARSPQASAPSHSTISQGTISQCAGSQDTAPSFCQAHNSIGDDGGQQDSTTA